MNTPSNNPVTGAAYFLRGLTLIGQPHIRRFVILPFIINVLIFAGLIVLAWGQFGQFVDWLIPSLPDWLAWLSWLLWLVFGLMAFIVIFFAFSILANLVGAPFNGYLAAAVERRLTGKNPPGSDRPFLQEFTLALLGELRKIGYFLLFAIPLLILNFIPVLNLASPALWALFGAWMLSLEYLDYPLANHGLTFPEIRRRLRRQRFLGLGFGAAVMLATLIPVFNFLVMPIAVAGATALRVERMPLEA